MTVQQLITELSKHEANKRVMVEVGTAFDGDTLFGDAHTLTEQRVTEFRNKGKYFTDNNGNHNAEYVLVLISDFFETEN